MIPDPAPPFEFEPSGAIKERMRWMVARAAELGVGKEILVALTEIMRFLRHSPRSWGDPIRDFRHAHLTEYRGQHKHFQCYYSVHDRIPIVFLGSLAALEGNPLHGEKFDGGSG